MRSTILAAACLGMLFLVVPSAAAQQFNGDNQWTAPHGVGTFVLTVGQEWSMLMAVAALRPDWEFNVGVTRYSEDGGNPDDDHYSGTFYLKRRFWENEAGNGGAAIMFGTGYSPSYLSAGEVIDTFETWWATGVYTVPFLDGAVTWDLLPGFILNLDKDRSGENTLNFSYGSRAAIYRIIPSSAIVAEVFGTAGEQYSPPQYRVGVRWESSRLVIAATYGRQFDGEGGPRLEIGALVFTNPLKIFCLGGGCD
jgi:hypothetical protein